MAAPSPGSVKRFIGGLAVTGVLVMTAASSILAQAGATGQISGVVRDESGGVLPGVDVTATQTDTGFKRTAISDGNGLYTLPALPTGPYRIDAMLSGFKAFQRAGVTLQVNGNLSIPIALSFGALSETVSVTGAAPLVETRNMGVGQVMDNERINQLPLNGRNTAELVQYAPAAVPAPAMNANARAFNGTQGARTRPPMSGRRRSTIFPSSRRIAHRRERRCRTGRVFEAIPRFSTTHGSGPGVSF